MSATSAKNNNGTKNSDDGTKFSQKISDDGMYDFLSNYYKEFNPVGQVLDSYNQVYNSLIDIIQKFKLQYIIKNTKAQEEIALSLKLTNPVIQKPGEGDLPYTSVQAIAEKKDFMCQYSFDIVFVFKLEQSKIKQQRITQMIDELCAKHDVLKYKEFNETILSFYPEYKKVKDDSDILEIKIGQLIFRLPVMTQTVMDPASTMTKRQLYDYGLDLFDLGGNIILNGVCWNIQNTFTYPYNLPIIAKTTINGQLVRADYLYQADVQFGNSYQSIFLLTSDRNTENIKGIKSQYTKDLVLNFKQMHDGNFTRNNHYIPVSLLFRAYGCKTDTKLLKYCVPDNDQEEILFLIDIFQNGVYHFKEMGNKRGYTQIQALSMIGKMITAKVLEPESYMSDFEAIDVAMYALSKYIYPVELGQESPYCQTLGEMCHKIYRGFKGQFTDRDALYNKRAVTVGTQIIAELRGKMIDSFKQAANMVKESIASRTFEELKGSVDTLEGVLKSMATQFSEKVDRSIKKSFTNADNSKIMKNMEELKSQVLSFMQKREIIIKSATSGGSVSFSQRKVQKSFYGFICPVTTPEGGANIGRYLSPTILSYMTVPQDADRITEFITKHKLFRRVMEENKNYFSVKVNFLTIGFVEDGATFKEFYNDLLKWRRDNAFFGKNLKSFQQDADQLFVSIYYSVENGEINISTDSGRIMVPIFSAEIVKKKLIKEIRKMLMDGDAMYICPQMAQNFVVGEYGRADIQDEIKYRWYFGPLGVMGPIPATAPFIQHLKSIRSSYLTSQMKSPQQQMISNYSNYYVKSLLTLNQNQYDPIQTPVQKVLQNKAPYGQHIYMAMMPYTDNQEDALIISEDFLHRYGFATTQFKTYDDQRQGSDEVFEVPLQKKLGYNYGKINTQACEITQMGANIQYGDVLISKVKIIAPDKIDQSTIYDQKQKGEYTFVSNLNEYSLKNENNHKCVRVAFGRMPSLGDKVTSKNCQKSTIGSIVPGYLMPRTEEGLIVNMIQNTDSVGRRETYGQIIEMYAHKYMLERGILRLESSIEKPLSFIHDLRSVKMDKLYNPYTNDFFNSPGCLVAPIVYCVQKHLVDEKIRVRADEGKVDMITKQPPAGKKNNGGLKIGDMERMAISASGAVNLLKSFFGKLSSNTRFQICKKCGNTDVIYDQRAQQYRCLNCGYLLANQVIQIDHSYNSRLLQHIFYSCGINQRFIEDK